MKDKQTMPKEGNPHKKINPQNQKESEEKRIRITKNKNEDQRIRLPSQGSEPQRTRKEVLKSRNQKSRGCTLYSIRTG
jgi:hypothetical protein